LTQAEGILATPALRGGRRQVSNSKQPPLVEGLTGIGNVTETVSEEKATEEETQKLLIKVVSRLGLEPRALALKDQTDRF
jgi:proteasome assembly chaperone (PAC2) family protein